MYVNFLFFIKKIKMAAISSILKLHQTRNSIKGADSYKEVFSENQISISIFITDIC